MDPADNSQSLCSLQQLCLAGDQLRKLAKGIQSPWRAILIWAPQSERSCDYIKSTKTWSCADGLGGCHGVPRHQGLEPSRTLGAIPELRGGAYGLGP